MGQWSFASWLWGSGVLEAGNRLGTEVLCSSFWGLGVWQNWSLDSISNGGVKQVYKTLSFFWQFESLMYFNDLSFVKSFWADGLGFGFGVDFDFVGVDFCWPLTFQLWLFTLFPVRARFYSFGFVFVSFSSISVSCTIQMKTYKYKVFLVRFWSFKSDFDR